MAFDQSGEFMSLPAAADFSSHQYKLVNINSSGQAALVAATGAHAIGVLQDAPAAIGRVAQIKCDGVSKVVAGTGGIDEGDFIVADSDGTAIVAQKAYTNTGDAGAAQDPLVGSYVVGVCVGAAAAGAIGSVRLTHMGAVPTTAA
jgi:hypothetical protein